jgi:hypothetical protein
MPSEIGWPGNDDWADAFGPMRKLPSPGQRWTVRRKAALVEVGRGGWLAIDEACQRYNLSVDEFLRGSGIWTATAFTVYEAPDTRSTAIPKRGGHSR